MTTIELAQRVARRTRTGEFTALALTEQMDVLQAINSALMKGYDKLPTYLREQDQGFTLPAPATLYNVTVVNGSTALSSSIFDPSQIGRTVVIAGDPQYNQILGTSTLRNPYMGPSGTAATATIYGDALFSTSYPFDRVIGNPRYPLQPYSNLTPMVMSRQTAMGWSWLFQNQIGRPITWFPQYMGNSQGNNPLLVLRFAPLPDQAYPIFVTLSLWPRRLLLQDLLAATTITVPDQLLESGLVPLAIRELMTSPIWKSISPANDSLCEARGVEALEFLKNQVADPAAPFNQVYTPIGY